MKPQDVLVSTLQGILFDLKVPAEITLIHRGEVDRAGRQIWGAEVTADDMTIRVDIRVGGTST